MDKLNPFKGIFKQQQKPNDSKLGQQVEYDEDVLSETKKDFEQRKTDRQFLELQWRLNMDFYDGNQFSTINKNTKNIEDAEKLYWWQEQEVFNQIAPIIETRLSKLGRLRPIPKTRPATNTDEDINNAKVSNKLLESTYYEQGQKEKQSVANMWSEITGTVIWKQVWDSEKGQQIASQEGERIHEGDTDVLYVNPFEIYPDSIWHDDVEHCKSIIHARAFTVEEIKDTWGKEIKGTDVNVLTVDASSLNIGSLGNMSSNYKISDRKQRDSAIVIEKWERPSKKYPNGRLIICTSNEILYVGDLPYMVGIENTRGLPFVVQKCIKVPSRFFGKSVIERLIPIQRRYNAIKNRKAEYINRVTIGQMVYEEGSVDADFLEEEGGSPGLMIPYNKGFSPPRYMESHSLPATVEKEESNLLDDFIRISGVSELSKDSSAPIGVKSGIALGILQEQDDTRLSLTASYIAEASVEVGKQILRLYKQFADTDRITRSVGSNFEVEVLTWNNSNITTDDVYVDSQAQSLESVAQRRNMVFDLLQTGLFNDPETGRISKDGISKIFDIIDLGHWEIGNDTNKLHMQKADRENINITNGTWENIDTYDDHLIHIAQHNKYRLTSDYEKLITDNPQINQMIEYHVMQHIEFVRNSMMNQQQEQQEDAV